MVLNLDSGSTGYEPYIVKDNVATLLRDIFPGTGSSGPLNYTCFNGKVYFVANNGTDGRELWVTDGAAALFPDRWDDLATDCHELITAGIYMLCI